MSDRTIFSHEPSLSQRIPIDLLVVLLLTAAAASVLLVVRTEFRAVRLVAGLTLLTFLPGYALTAVLFPSDALAGTDTTSRAISWPRRYALSMILSLILVPAVALTLEFAGYGYTWAQTTLFVAGVTGLLTVAAAVVRLRMPAGRRLSVPLGAWYAHLRGLVSYDGWTGLALNGILLLSVVLAAGGVTHALTQSPDESVTELYLLTENEQGELVADDFPQQVAADEPTEVVVGVERQGGGASGADYTVVVLAQRVEGTGDDLTVVTQRQVDQFGADLGTDSRFRQQVQFSLETVGARYRVAFLLYEGDPPANPTLANAHREVHLLIDVESSVDLSDPVVTSETHRSEPVVVPDFDRRRFSRESRASETAALLVAQRARLTPTRPVHDTLRPFAPPLPSTPGG